MSIKAFLLVLVLANLVSHAYTLSLEECGAGSAAELAKLKNISLVNGNTTVADDNVSFCELHEELMRQVNLINTGDFQLNSKCILHKFYTSVCTLSAGHLRKSSALFCKDLRREFSADHQKSGGGGANQDPRYIWGYGFLSVTIISLCSLIGISILPVIHKPIYNKVLLFLICLSVGTLAGNAVFQLIPEGLDAYNDPKTVWRSCVVALGIYIFYLVENVLENLFKTKHTHGNQASCMSSNFLKEKSESAVETPRTTTTDASNSMLLASGDGGGGLSADDIKMYDFKDSSSVEENLKVTVTTGGDEAHGGKRSFFDLKEIKSIAWMITVADGLHNFIDGMAIGASFVVSPVQGLSTSVAIFCEEFPHELGDFAILLNAGMTIQQAAFFNFASACCCYLGLIVGVILGQELASATWIFALAGGVFLYISLAGMLPEARSHSLIPDLIDRPWLCFVLQNTGLLTGFLAMFLLTYYKDSLTLA